MASQAILPRHPLPDVGRDQSRNGLWIVVLAGGQGVRLRAFIRKALGHDRPKQFCRIIGSRSMLRHTWDRALRLVPADRVVTVITEGQERFVADEGGRGIPGRVLVQPFNRETGPGLLLPLLWIARRDPSAMIAVFPADHFIWEEARFVGCVEALLAAAQRFPHRLVLLGMEARGPETSYGWIAPGEPLDGGFPEGSLFSVAGFWEKPDLEKAGVFYAQGYLWNSLVLAGRAAVLLRLAEAHLPASVAILREASAWLDTSGEIPALAAAYRQLRPSNLSREVLEPGRAALLVQAARGISWCDWGDPARILRTLQQFNCQPSWLPVFVGAEGSSAVL
ncbi:MAG TPA: sugar phosphate nucleotidyltransferase [Candidatus Sulfotelmatobacter sp.]|nr:sugar phosphate nucleotidyltransferase [Candidatus Sulfotelmatobacter sp.]